MSEGNEWSQAWLEAQRQYWDGLFDWSRKLYAAAPEPGGSDVAQDTLTDWWKTVSAALPADSREIYKRMFDSSQSFTELGQTFWNMVRDAQSAGENWRDSLEESLGAFKAMLQDNASQANDAWSGFAGGWGFGGDAWQDFMRSLGQSPVHAEDITGFNAGEAWNKLLGTPALGYTREWQEKVQQWVGLSTEYAKVSQEYAKLLQSTNQQAVDLLGRRITDLAQKGESPDTLRGMYDLWVDCGEEAYAELAEDDSYLKAQGRLMNTLMRLRQHEQDMMQDVFGVMNIPGRRELDTALCRLQETRRELRDLKDLIEDTGVDELRTEVAALRAELAAIKGGSASATAQASTPARGGTRSAAAAKPAPARKAAPKKAAATTRKTTAKKKAAAKKS